ncbi:hypothetical protein ERO13_D10G150800v2 [Gossypium hirsutum]|uniref:Serine aminopeptidase S33 domain-containing protein n=1 Tax=Gossypium hirsutum TaxID=3635 RepID=A0ABM3AV21_GOSHI|nr:uncharacterized protein LOC107914863 [Gossypium hirsutum]KAG4126332.1 hypothetical protein ERO13_D10G150800v2 [Gossypium hirsutum]
MEQLVNFIIRPPRAEYNPESDLLDEEFMLKGKWYQRKDIEVKNGRGDVLRCSHYVPLVSPEGKPLPCVIYCHGNSGCRADASEAAIILLPSNITVFTLDFSGSGLSGGEHVTLGWNEKDDLKAVVDYLRADGNVSLIGLWGRSMGAVTSLMYGAEDPSIAGIVLDSPFSDLVELMLELVDTYKFRLPKFTVKFAIQFMRKSIQKKAKFDITDLNTIKVAKSCFVPALFGHAIGDDFIRPHHSDRIFEAYMGDKNIIKFEGDHNSPRPQFYFDSINIFFHNVLQPPEDEVGATLYDSIHDYFGKGTWAIPEVGFFPDSSTASKATSSTSDAINQVRSKRPMSRTEVPSDIPSEENLPGCQDKDTVDNGSSSSNMISFELSNGHPFDPHVPTTMDDDQYVEYQLDDLTGFPCNVEEEERMFMEAIIESLKDLDMRQPQTEEQAKACADSSESAKKDEINGRDTCSTTEKSSSLPLESTSTQVVHVQVPFETQSTLVINGSNVGLEHASPDTSMSSLGRAFDRSPSTEETVSTSCARTDTSASTQSSSDADMSGSTKATVTVIRNPSNNIMDGLMRRWDLNFFRNSR